MDVWRTASRYDCEEKQKEFANSKGAFMSLQHHPEIMLELYRDRTERLGREIERQRLLTGLPQSPGLWRRLLAVSWPFSRNKECPPITPALPAATVS